MKLTAIFLFRSKCLLGFLLAALFLLAPAADSLWGASENSDLRTRGKLAILGLRNAETIKSFHFPEDSYLVLIRPAGTQTPADTVPSLDTDQQSPAEAESDRYFVCLINHLSTGERLLLSDAADGRWDEIDFLDAVLIADGVSDRERAACREIYNRHLENLRREIGETDDDFEKVRHVYEYLHREILTGSYDLNLSSAAACLQTGIYNCVSATALFNALAGDVGLTSFGLEMTGHAKSRILCGDSYLDIETTCPKWDLLPDRPVPIPETEPGTALWARDAAFFRQVNYLESTSAYPSEETQENQLAPAPLLEADGEDSEPVTPERALALSGKKPVRTVTPVQFVATIYYNRAVDYYQENKFDSAIYAYLKALAIDPNNKTVLGNFKATLNNLAIELASRGKNYNEAIRLTEQGLALDPNFDQFRVNLPLYYHHWSSELRKNNRLEEALRVEARYRRAFPQSEAKIF
ncbi:MAG: tetratricopeptide repeat protein [Thermoguttaceae bacterium]|nr:tetratricopeptide repeat protein [Thermoguttaceae bacterium]